MNATGVWADDVRALDEGTHPRRSGPRKGIHITVPWSLVQNKIAAVIPVPKDRRSVFVVPWGGEGGAHRSRTSARPTPTTTAPIDDPQITPDDVDVPAARDQRRGRRRRSPRPTSSARGPACGRSSSAAKSERTADLSRRHSVHTSDSGVITVTGGKLTTYRRMAADTVDEVVKILGPRPARSQTKQHPAARRRRLGRARHPERPRASGTAPTAATCSRSQRYRRRRSRSR